MDYWVRLPDAEEGDVGVEEVVANYDGWDRVRGG